MSKHNRSVDFRKPRLTCRRCQYQWKPRSLVIPKSCPNCHSYAWDRPSRYTPPAGDQVKIAQKLITLTDWDNFLGSLTESELATLNRKLGELEDSKHD